MNESPASGRLIVGTRGSKLARAQTQWVVNTISAAHPGLDVAVEIISTTGDREQGKPLPEIGGKGLFTEELEQALMDGSIDLAVHSAKDLPTQLAEGLDVLAWPVREDPRDAWVSADGTRVEDLPPGSVVGTSSLRRQAQLLRRQSDLKFVALRGNVDTRIRKVHRGDCAGAVLAMAGLKRSGLAEHVTHPIESDIMLSAPGQGALALEGRSGDDRVQKLLSAIHHEPTAIAVCCERIILDELDAGCHAPVGIYAEVQGNELHCQALVLDPQGNRLVQAADRAPITEAANLAAKIVKELKAAGAAEIIAECRRE